MSESSLSGTFSISFIEGAKVINESELDRPSDRVQNLDLSPREALEYCNRGAVLLDVREEYVNEFKLFDVPTAFQIPFSHLKAEYAALPKEKLIIVSDTSGLRSGETLEFLNAQGFHRLAILAGGFVEWERDGMPILADNSEKLTGSCACQLRARGKKKGENSKE